MTFRPCAVIPVYNHHEQLPAVMASLHQHNLPCIVVDDGSCEQTRQALAELEKNSENTRFFRLSWNQGKGAAVMEGLMRAREAGFSHAVQVDADGQHDCGALPALLQEAEQYPDALISGTPVYDESVPSSRLYGRKITRFWVWIETLSSQIQDAMIGFRVYPLEATCTLITQKDLTRRMDFDIEIIVRLYWLGLMVRSVPVRIVYPENGVSHFDTLRDNVRISLLHSRLFFGMLKRFPALIRQNRQRSQHDKKHWSDIQERGAEAGIRFLLATYRVLGHKAFSFLLLPVMTYFFITGRQARKSSLGYLQNLYQVSPESLPSRPGYGLSFRHFLSFGHTLADRFAAWSGDITLDDLDITGDKTFREKIASGRGAVLLVSHLGNIELCRALVRDKSYGRPIVVNVLVHTRHAPAFNKILKEMNPEAGINLVQVSDIGPDTSIMLSEMIDRGEMVAIAADRMPVGDTSSGIGADFMGQSARFPSGPFVLASVLRAPVFTLFCTRQETGRFLLDIELFADSLSLPRKRRQACLEAAVIRYSRRLQATCQQSPLEWFNFFDFWHQSGVSE
ncbi:glycosyltransferase family 2 protein [Endozoicomonas atrinae]|uniref:glycosyltransferase family 2 protein n=1 Tax=Endozoicomonas atrinae TaxID=1333660 RepID=UPI000825B925|nr:glycosyltransferase family 2 protein [Endozoicomonas atrinae]